MRALRLTEDQYQALLAKQRGEQPSAKLQHGHSRGIKVKDDGFVFDSRAEHARYIELKWLQHVGKISDLRVHTCWTFVVNGVKIGTYTDDFNYIKAGQLVVEDVKNKFNATERSFRRTLKLMRAHHGIEIQVIIMQKRGPYGY